LSKKEVRNALFRGNNKHKVIFLILLIIAFSIVGIFIVVIVESAINNTYPTGTKYSTVKIKDFNKKK
jgi:hypothetical protein